MELTDERRQANRETALRLAAEWAAGAGQPGDAMAMRRSARRRFRAFALGCGRKPCLCRRQSAAESQAQHARHMERLREESQAKRRRAA